MRSFGFIDRVDANVQRIRAATLALQEDIIAPGMPAIGPAPAQARPRVSADRLTQHTGASDDPGAPLAANAEHGHENEQSAGEPLLRAPRTYNTSHPGYDPAVVRNFPGCLFNGDKPSANPALRAMRDLVQGTAVSDRTWDEELEMELAELRAARDAYQLFEHRERAERYFLGINDLYGTNYEPGWMNLDDALLLYWLIRQLKPRTIVETGVCNGFSTGLIALALDQNRNGGKVHAIGRAKIFDSMDPIWTEEGRHDGEVVVGGQNIGWMVPDAYRNCVELYSGDAESVLPDLVDRLESVDLFFHDSDHSYDHMTFEFNEVIRKLSKPGIIVADNIAWNASLWDFADKCGVPAYNFRGSVGVAFFG